MKKFFSILAFLCLVTASFAADPNTDTFGIVLDKTFSGDFGDIPFDSKLSPGIGGSTNIPKRIAMFLIPLNYTTRGEWEQFELKASTNNFSHSIAEFDRLLYYSESQIANTGADEGAVYSTTYDKMWCFVGTSFFVQSSGFRGDNRSYYWITNTMPGIGWEHQMTTVAVLVDTTCLRRHPEGKIWLEDKNQDLMWVWHKSYHSGTNVVHEVEPGSESNLWRPIAPIRWFEEMPNWAWEQIPELKNYYIDSK